MVEGFKYTQPITLGLSTPAGAVQLLPVDASECCHLGIDALILWALLIVGKVVDQFYERDAEMLSDCRY